MPLFQERPHQNFFAKFCKKYGKLDYSTYCQVSVLEKWFPLQGERGHSSYLGVFKNKIERSGRQNNNSRPIDLPNVIIFSTDFRYTTQS